MRTWTRVGAANVAGVRAGESEAGRVGNTPAICSLAPLPAAPPAALSRPPSTLPPVVLKSLGRPVHPSQAWRQFPIFREARGRGVLAYLSST